MFFPILLQHHRSEYSLKYEFGNWNEQVEILKCGSFEMESRTAHVQALFIATDATCWDSI
jgi:hypothetical protein